MAKTISLYFKDYYSIFHRYFAIQKLKRANCVILEHGNKGMSNNSQVHVQQTKALLENYVNDLGDKMPDSSEVLFVL